MSERGCGYAKDFFIKKSSALPKNFNMGGIMMEKLLKFLNELEVKKIYYKLNKVRDAVMVEIVVPGERWEVEFFDDGTVEIEKFISCGEIYSESETEMLFEKFSD